MRGVVVTRVFRRKVCSGLIKQEAVEEADGKDIIMMKWFVDVLRLVHHFYPMSPLLEESCKWAHVILWLAEVCFKESPVGIAVEDLAEIWTTYTDMRRASQQRRGVAQSQVNSSDNGAG